MVRKDLMDIVTLSGVRKEILFYLYDSQRSLVEIREHLDMTSPEVSPRIKELIEHNLVLFVGKKYKLTPMGKTIVMNFLPFYNTMNVFDQYWEWWEAHDVSSIPDELLRNIGNLKDYIIIEDDNDNLNRTAQEMRKIIANSKSLAGVSCAFDESFPDIFLTVAKNDTPISIVITKEIYNILKDNYIELINDYLKTGNSIYIFPGELKISHIVTDNYLFFSLYYINGKMDFHTNLISDNSTSLKWGVDLFEYYRARAIKLNMVK